MVNQLKESPEGEEYLHKYLSALFEKDPNLGRAYHDLQVRLFAQYDPDSLLSFLKKSTCRTGVAAPHNKTTAGRTPLSRREQAACCACTRLFECEPGDVQTRIA